tara:strand:+ start:1191 stop:1397 length:207 start_codon:yes stop_codon:yes gene_type:complete
MNQTGTDDIIKALEDAGVPVTLENWMDFAYFGDAPKFSELSQEEIDVIPAHLVKIHKIKNGNRNTKKI